jgi:hypothetical protein
MEPKLILKDYKSKETIDSKDLDSFCFPNESLPLIYDSLTINKKNL